MKRFIKKNLFLVGVCGISALGILVLLVLSCIQYFAMSSAIKKTEELRKKNDELMGFKVMSDGRKLPPRADFIPPVKENVELLGRDIEGYKQAEENLRKYFGQPLYPALTEFCDTINEANHVKGKGKGKKKGSDKDEKTLTPEKLRDYFLKFWEEEKSKNSPNHQNVCRGFAKWGAHKDRKYWTDESWEEALYVFAEAAGKATMEKITDDNREAVFLASLGVLRDLEADSLQLFVSTMQKEVIERFKDNMDVKWINFHEQHVVAPLRTEEEFSDNFNRTKDKSEDERRSDNAPGSSVAVGGDSDDEKKEGPTAADEIRHWDIVGDLANRICRAKLKTLERMAYSDLVGRKFDDGNKKCRFYTYTVTVTGTEQSVRTFMNLLIEAYTDHRIYVVRNMSIAKQEDQVQDVIDADIIKASRTPQNNSNSNGGIFADVPGQFNGGMNSGSQSNVIDDDEEYFIEEGKKNECVAGRSQQITVTFTIDYVVYDNFIDLKKKD